MQSEITNCNKNGKSRRRNEPVSYEIPHLKQKLTIILNSFEAEISGTPGFINPGFGYQPILPAFGNIPPPPPPPPVLIPQQVRNAKKYSQATYISQPEVYTDHSIMQPAVVSSEAKLYGPSKQVLQPAMMVTTSIDISALQAEVEKKLKKLKPDKVSVAAEVAISQGKASSALQSFGPDDYKRRGKYMGTHKYMFL